MTRIVFDSKGRPSWFKVNTGAFMHDVAALRARTEYTDNDKQWFRAPLRGEGA
jgi:hypothetical protein